MSSNTWEPVDRAGRLHRAQYHADVGSPYSLMLRLAEDKFLIYSPGPGVIESARTLLCAVSETPRLILLAPSTGHNLGLRAWRKAFPRAELLSAADAAPALTKKTGLSDFRTPESLETDLPDNVRILTLPDNPFSELWLRLTLDSEPDTVYWAVCDSLMNLPSLGSNALMRMLLRLYGLKVGLHVHRRFCKGLQNPEEFRDWALQHFAADCRHVLLPCHGDIFEAEAGELRTLIEQRLG